MMDEIIRFFLANANSLSYLFVPIGLIYQAWRQIVNDVRVDKREGMRDEVVVQLSERMRDMQTRGDAALEHKARLIVEKELLSSEITDLKAENQDLQREKEALQMQIKLLREKSGGRS